MASRLDSNLLTIQGYRELPDTATSTSVGAFLTQIYETTITRAKKNQTFIEKTHSSRYSRSVLRDEHGKQPFGPSVIRQSYGRDFSLARHLRSVQGTSASIHVAARLNRPFLDMMRKQRAGYITRPCLVVYAACDERLNLARAEQELATDSQGVQLLPLAEIAQGLQWLEARMRARSSLLRQGSKQVKAELDEAVANKLKLINEQTRLVSSGDASNAIAPAV
eukprot:TRINITY_DN11773_c1_g1_i12.p1 TRINITY_DN11773_c1_g1~~TRINITY_DN11773_c1_g1_i12.p1  ORF type:complete len:222 (+),score=37.37 TRINITY_DN11773_c1_g1_i12:983-1648(+)